MADCYDGLCVECLPVGMMQVNCYLVYDSSSMEGIVVDPGDEGNRILDTINRQDLKIQQIVLTHGHVDHIAAVDYLRKQLNVKVAIGEQDAPMLTSADLNLSTDLGQPVATDPAEIMLGEGDNIKVGKFDLKVLHTPGHTLGGISLCHEGFVINGDLIFAGSIGRTDFPNGSYNILMQSIKDKILPLDDITVIYSGHGPKTSVGQEKLMNPFLIGG